MFEDRIDAGRRLARALAKYRGGDVLVLAIPRGGAVVGDRVAEYLNAEFSLIASRKLPLPYNPEAGFGAVAEDGSIFMLEEAAGWVTRDEIARIVEEQRREITRRIDALRGGEPLPPIKGRVVILVDDGIAMGSTMSASIMMCRNKKAGKIVVAAPVAGPEAAREMRRLADEAVILETPPFFQAVAQAYQEWYDLSDGEVLEVMAKWRQRRRYMQHKRIE